MRKNLLLGITLFIGSIILLITGSTIENNPVSEFSLPVPLFKQQKLFECNIVATQMVLAYRGYPQTSEQVFNSLPHENTPYDPEKSVWGDPNVGYVGDIFGDTKGYGIHWEPIAKYINQYTQAIVKRNWSLQELLQEVAKGNPSILWWQNGVTIPSKLEWTTKNGDKIIGVEGMHSEVVIGFTGDISNPQEIILNDPWRGRRKISVTEFSRLWSYYQNTAVVVLS